MCTQSLGPLPLAVSEIWDLKVPIAADTDRYLSAVTFPLNILACEIGSLCAQGFRKYGNLKFTRRKAYLFNIDTAWKSPWKNGNAKDAKAYRDLRYSIGTHSIAWEDLDKRSPAWSMGRC